MLQRCFRILVLMLFTQQVSGQSQPDTAAVLDYLRVNSEQLDLSATHTPVLFDSSLYQHSIFLFGENHGSAEPHQADLYLFKTLNREAGVRTYIAEVDVTKAWMLENYLADGKETWLKKVFAGWVADTLQWASNENYNKFRELRKFYVSLPASGKFHVAGIDVTQDYSLLKEHLNWILSQSKPPKGSLYLDSLKQVLDTATREGRLALGAFARRFLDEMKSNMRLAGTTARNHKQFLRLLHSLSYIEKGVSRDSIMFRNFEDYAALSADSSGKYYGFLGLYHCLTAGYNNKSGFAALLQTGSEMYAGRVSSFIMNSVNSKSMLPLVSQMRSMMPKFVIDKTLKENPEYTDGRYLPYDLSNDQPMVLIRGTELLKQSSRPNSVTLFRLTSAGSPYKQSKLSGEVAGMQPLRLTGADAVTTDAMQFILLFRNAHAATPIAR